MAVITDDHCIISVNYRKFNRRHDKKIKGLYVPWQGNDNYQGHYSYDFHISVAMTVWLFAFTNI